MFKRQKTGSVVCASCGSLVGVNDEQCYNCGRRNPGLWGFGPVLRRLGTDFGFVPIVIYGCATLYILTLVVTVMLGGNVMGGGLISLLAPADGVALLFGMSGAIPVFRLGRVVDGPQRWLASWQRAAHHVQHDVGPRPGPTNRGHVRGRPPRDHLHDLVGLRVSLELCHGPTLPRCTASRRCLARRWERRPRFVVWSARCCTMGIAAGAA